MQNLPLNDRRLAYREANPRDRLAEIAKALAASEMGALVCQLDNKTVVPLQPNWCELFDRLPQLGHVMVLSRNAWVVHECIGHYAPATWNGAMGFIQGQNIDLRMLTNCWKYLFAAQVAHTGGILHSLQIFDESGMAVHKIYLEQDGHGDAFAALVDDLKLEHWIAPQKLIPALEMEKFRAITLTEIHEFRRDWTQFQDTHDFFGMLRKHQVSRLQAMHIAEASFVQELELGAVQDLLQKAQLQSEPLIACVGNRGMIQIYSGTIRNFKKMGDWLHVLDPAFNLHINTRGMHRVFIVHKPTRHGIISSLDVFSAPGELILSLFGYRKDNLQPSETWGQLLATLRNI
ncbi:MAG TPA: ChuX/HutX family heme-like substrate-binding protein [Oligoflexus sp.]|uniref:ChuX/HutX family heme-like substrate-binding protein n=1 Tax=Oligoflexus sp. TaxID=1971216 RepID=UPI002D31811A|nr:ChuX/HutX family heme-like substrate-binding protein [Oligoflexus sp.]HYX35836.1 ChuX/HutX family heme-like substrate-binding protein [Oligoflexus sp.]